MEPEDFFQFSTTNASLLSGQHSNLIPNDPLQLPNTNLNQSGYFDDSIELETVKATTEVVRYDQSDVPNVFGVTTVIGKAGLNLAIATAQGQLESFATNDVFLGKMNQAFGDDWHPESAQTLIQDLVTGEAMPDIKLLPAADLKANGAFGEETIYLSDEFLTNNADDPEAVAGVLLEELGHYIDQTLSQVDSQGDEGEIFAKLVQDETLTQAELAKLKAEDESQTIVLDGKQTSVELAEPEYPGYNLVYDPSAPEYGENPEVVKLWQQRMDKLGYAIEVDGYYGEESAAVATQFQTDQGLMVDGIVGPETWEATFSTEPSQEPPAPPPPAGTQSPVSGDIDPQPGFGDLNVWRYNTGGRSDPGIIEPSKETVLITHGWRRSDQAELIQELAREASEDDIQVLALDWSSIADAGLDQLTEDIPDFPGYPDETAAWITPVAEWAHNSLVKLGIDPNQLTLVGHSLGAYVSSEIAQLFGQVKNVVALDPAYPADNGPLWFKAYDLDGRTDIIDPPVDFLDVADNSLAFVVADSGAIGGLAGDTNKAATAEDSFILRFSEAALSPDARHESVVNVFTDALNRNFLELPDLALPDHQDNWYDASGIKTNPDSQHEGKIAVAGIGTDSYIEDLTLVADPSGTEETPWT